METRERRIPGPSEPPTQPRVRLPGLTLPRALPQVPWLRGWAGEDGGRAAATGALAGPRGGEEAGREGWHGGR